MKITVSIILLNYNWKQFNKDCIDSILAQNYQDFEIIFVDQCSTDWSLEEVEYLYKKEIESNKIKIIKNEKNGWFAWWNNLWVLNSNEDSEYICLLNNDTIVPKDRLKKLVDSIKSDKLLWAVSCNVRDKWLEQKQKKQTFKNHKKVISSIFWEFILDDMEQSEIRNKFYYTTVLWWCCLLYKRSIIKKPFEDYYFIYAEDVYLSWYILNMWYKLWVSLDTYVNHYWSWTSWRKPSPFKLFHGNKNQIINFLIFYPLLYKILLFPLFIIKEVSHLFLWVPFMRLKAKIKWRYWIIKNYTIIRETKKHIKNNKSYYKFINQLSFKLTDYDVTNNQFFKVFIFIINELFWWYWKIVKNFIKIFDML